MTQKERDLSVASHRVMEDMAEAEKLAEKFGESPSTNQNYKIALGRFIYLLNQYGIEHNLYSQIGNKNAVKLFIKLNQFDKEKKEEEQEEMVKEYTKEMADQLAKQGIKV